MITHKELEEMSKENIEIMNRTDLSDITTIHIGQDLLYHEKILDFLEEIKNPYCFLCGNVPVKVCFSDNGSGLKDILETYFIHLKKSW